MFSKHVTGLLIQYKSYTNALYWHASVIKELELALKFANFYRLEEMAPELNREKDKIKELRERLENLEMGVE